ncbi:TRAP transporter substrate-binding protein DctP [Shinella sp.]|uniref:TRAP transporter substrate-binding protein DctP n=1 Tax=Shinella sp. TaxID=1870904 RepID=UPI00258FB37A|nr:TRAP transporter substrate-binding protein DctP [Shinella sp.]MCW5706957.1 TRAP transporter substrate-binding protein DctP [Shinella sp.]
MIEDCKRSGGNGISRRLFLASTVGAAASASLLANTVTEAMAQAAPRVLKFSDHEPLGGMRTRFLKDVVFPAIEKESNGRLKIEDHWNGEIAAAYDALGAVSKGATDIGTVVPEYTAKELPLHQIFKSFIKGPVGGRQIDFFNRVYSDVPAFPAELDKNNIVQIYFGTGYPVAFFRNAPMAGLDELKGGKWRSASFWHLDFLKNAGAIPVTMHWGPEIPEALKAKTLDGLMVNVDSGYMLKVHESAPHVLVSKDLWLGHVYILTMNKDVWNSLAQEDKDAIGRAAKKSYETLGDVMEKSFDAQLDDLKKAGATVRVLSTDEVARFETATRYKEVQAAWAEERRTEGVTDAAAAIGQVTSIISDFVG